MISRPQYTHLSFCPRCFCRLCVCLTGLAVLGASSAGATEDDDISPLPVLYQRQQDRTLCQSASVSMFLKHVAGKDVAQKEIRDALIKLGGQYLHTTRLKLVQSYLPEKDIAFRYVIDENIAWREIRDLLRQKIPVILSTRLTRSGHVVLVIGAAEKKGERRVIVHDPWGRFDFQTRKFGDKNGAGVSYPFAELLNRTRLIRGTTKAGSISFSEWYCTGTRQWLLNKNKRAACTDLQVVEEKADWRYIRCQAR